MKEKQIETMFADISDTLHKHKAILMISKRNT